MDLSSKHLLVAVGSSSKEVCSIGSFARAEAKAFEKIFRKVEILEPDENGRYPVVKDVARPDFIFFHAPSLHDRKRPWNALLSAMFLRRAFPRARFVPIVHEYCEAPLHWKIRQVMILKMSSGAVVNTHRDYQMLRRWQRHTLRSPLGPTLWIGDLGAENILDRIVQARKKVAAAFNLPTAKKWVTHPGLLTPGKGIDLLKGFAVTGEKPHWIVMGGMGPKARDKEFARTVLKELNSVFGESVTFIESPSDEVFKNVLLASDLVFLPYDNGVSERRSSFLSAASCGANIFTTTGELSGPLDLDNSGAKSVSARAPIAEARQKFELAVLEASHSTANRLKNVAWSRERSWQRRVDQIALFLEGL